MTMIPETSQRVLTSTLGHGAPFGLGAPLHADDPYTSRPTTSVSVITATEAAPTAYEDLASSLLFEDSQPAQGIWIAVMTAIGAIRN